MDLNLELEEGVKHLQPIAELKIRHAIPLILPRLESVSQLRDILAEYASECLDELHDDPAISPTIHKDGINPSSIGWVRARQKAAEATVGMVSMDESAAGSTPLVHLRVVKKGKGFGVEITPILEKSGLGEKLGALLNKRLKPMEDQLLNGNPAYQSLLSKIQWRKLCMPLVLFTGAGIGTTFLGGVGAGTYEYFHEKDEVAKAEEARQEAFRMENSGPALTSLMKSLEHADPSMKASLIDNVGGEVYQKLESLLESKDVKDRTTALSYIPILFSENKKVNANFWMDSGTGLISNKDAKNAELQGAMHYFKGLVIRHIPRETDPALKQKCDEVIKDIDARYEKIVDEWTAFDVEKGKGLAEAVRAASGKKGEEQILYKILYGEGNHHLYRSLEETLLKGTDEAKEDMLSLAQIMIPADIAGNGTVNIHPGRNIKVLTKFEESAESKTLSAAEYWENLLQNGSARTTSPKLQNLYTQARRTLEIAVQNNQKE